MTNLHLFLFFLLFECNVVHSFFVDGFNQKMLINENTLNFVNVESLFHLSLKSVSVFLGRYYQVISMIISMKYIHLNIFHKIH